MDRQDLQKLRDLPIEEVAGRLGLEVTRHKCLCPFHEDHHASLTFNLRRNTCRCYVCMDDSIGTIDLVMRMLHKTFVEACQWLADGSNIILAAARSSPPPPPPRPFDASRYERYFARPWLNDAAKAFLFGERRLDSRVVRWCRLTSWQDRDGLNWLQIPYYDTSGRLVGVQNRNLQKGASPRFRFPYGADCSIYNLPVTALLSPGEPLYITEGCSDCWAMLSAGHKAIAIPSATLLKPRDVKFLTALSAERATPFHMYPDQDAPGEHLFLQLKEALPGLERHQLPKGCKDFGEYWEKTLPAPLKGG